MKLSDTNKGILYIMISAFGFAMMSCFVKLSGDLPSFQKTFFRNIVSVVMALFFVIKNKQRLFGKLENQKLLLLRSTFGTLGILFNFYAIDRLVLSDANMLNKLSPFFVVIFSAIFLKEKVNAKQIISVLIAFLGMLFIIKPQFNVSFIPYLSGIIGGISAAAAYTCLRFLGKKENHYTIVFYFSFFSVIVLFPLLVIYYEPMKTIQLVYLLLSGVFASIGQFGITLAYKYAPAKKISIFDYSNIIYSAIISVVVFGQIPDALSFVGYFIIFGASLYIFLYNKKLEENQAIGDGR